MTPQRPLTRMSTCTATRSTRTMTTPPSSLSGRTTPPLGRTRRKRPAGPFHGPPCPTLPTTTRTGFATHWTMTWTGTVGTTRTRSSATAGSRTLGRTGGCGTRQESGLPRPVTTATMDTTSHSPTTGSTSTPFRTTTPCITGS